MFHEKEHISKEQTAYLRRTQKRKAAVWLLQVLLLILFFLLWEIAADCGWIDPFLFSQPTELFATAVKMIRDGSLSCILHNAPRNGNWLSSGDNSRHADGGAALLHRK